MSANLDKQERDKLLKGLNERKLPFRNDEFVKDGQGYKKIGEGGFAYIYEVKNQYGLQRAVKIIGLRDTAMSEDGRAQFKKECELQIELQQKCINIVKIDEIVSLCVKIGENDELEDAVELNGAMNQTEEEVVSGYRLLDFIRMEELAPVLDKNRNNQLEIKNRKLEQYDEQEVLRFALDIGNALKTAHDNRILHRDVKLENTFYMGNSERYIYKLGDFGIARIIQNEKAYSMAGTPGNMAPEQLMGEAADPTGDGQAGYDSRADIYSYGLMLYILMNEFRYPGSKSYKVNARVQYSKDALPEPVNGSKELKAVVKKACMYRSEDRYQDMDGLMKDLRAISEKKTAAGRKAAQKRKTALQENAVRSGSAVSERKAAPEENVVQNRKTATPAVSEYKKIEEPDAADEAKTVSDEPKPESEESRPEPGEPKPESEELDRLFENLPPVPEAPASDHKKKPSDHNRTFSKKRIDVSTPAGRRKAAAIEKGRFDTRPVLLGILGIIMVSISVFQLELSVGTDRLPKADSWQFYVMTAMLFIAAFEAFHYRNKRPEAASKFKVSLIRIAVFAFCLYCYITTGKNWLILAAMAALVIHLYGFLLVAAIAAALVIPITFMDFQAYMIDGRYCWLLVGLAVEGCWLILVYSSKIWFYERENSTWFMHLLTSAVVLGVGLILSAVNLIPAITVLDFLMNLHLFRVGAAGAAVGFAAFYATMNL